MKYAICVLTLLLTFLLVGCDSEAPAVAEPTVTEPVIFQTEPQETLPFSFTSEQFLKIDGYFDHTPMAECAPLADGVPYLQVSDPTNEVSVLQGGCTDGEYFYMVVEGSNLEIDGVTYKKAHKIYKIDCKTFETVAVSEILPLDHANSMCYNSKLDMLLVANCNDVITDDGLDTSDNILLSAIGRARNTGAQFDGEKMMELGTAPIMAEVLEADIRLKTVHGDKLKVWGVNAEGFYAGKLPTTYENGELCFHIGDVQNPACYYLIVKE